MVLEINLLILGAIHKGNNIISIDGVLYWKFAHTDLLNDWYNWLSDTSLLCHLHHRSHYIMMSLCMCVCVFLRHLSPPLFAHTLQSCPTLCSPTDSSPPGSCVPGILQAKTLEWAAISFSNACMHAKLLQSCPTPCYPIDSSPPGSPIPGILQAKTLEWAAISFSNARRWKVKVKSLSRVRLFSTPWIAAHQALPSMGFFRQEYWSGVQSPSLVTVLRPSLFWV